MPEIGDRNRASNGQLQVWWPCDTCLIPRWVRLIVSTGEPLNKMCRICSGRAVGRIGAPELPTYGALHLRLQRIMIQTICDMCGDTIGPFRNACVNPTRWGVASVGAPALMGEDEDDYRRMCIRCHEAHDQRIRQEALAAYFGIPIS